MLHLQTGAVRSPGALTRHHRARPYTGSWNDSVVTSKRRGGRLGGTCRKLDVDLSCCSVTPAHSISNALAQPLIHDIAASIAIMISSASLIFLLSFIRSQGLVDRVSVVVIEWLLPQPR